MNPKEVEVKRRDRRQLCWINFPLITAHRSFIPIIFHNIHKSYKDFVTQVGKISIFWRNNVGNLNIFTINIASIYPSNAVFTKLIFILRISICWIFYMIHHGSITFCVVTIWRENKYRSQPLDLSLACTSFTFFPSAQPFHLFLRILTCVDFSATASRFCRSWFSTFCSQTLKHHFSSPSVSCFWQCDPIAPSSHWRHEYLTLKLAFKQFSPFSLMLWSSDKILQILDFFWKNYCGVPGGPPLCLKMLKCAKFCTFWVSGEKNHLKVGVHSENNLDWKVGPNFFCGLPCM